MGGSVGFAGALPLGIFLEGQGSRQWRATRYEGSDTELYKPLHARRNKYPGAGGLSARSRPTQQAGSPHRLASYAARRPAGCHHTTHQRGW